MYVLHFFRGVGGQEKNEGWLRTLEQTYEEYGISPRMENTCYLYVEKGVHCIGDVIRLRRNMLGDRKSVV